MRFRVGTLGLLMLIGNQLGSNFGMAVALCVWMIADALVEAIVASSHKSIRRKKGG